MDSRKLMLCWTPGTDHVALIPWPDTKDISSRYAYTALACYHAYQELPFEKRKAIILAEAMHLTELGTKTEPNIVRDGISPSVLHRVLMELDEYRDAMAEDIPDMKQGIIQ